MKKILIVLLASILLFSNFTGMTAADDNLSVNTGSKEAVVVLERLGIISLSDVEMQDIAPLSRASYASIVASALKLTESEPSIYFSDVLRTHSAASSINALYERGLVSGIDGKNFEPDENIRFDAALKIMLIAAGYGEYAETKGGFPTGYIITGKMLDVIPDNINNDGTITIFQAAELIYKVMTVGLYDPVIISGDGSVKKEVIDETLLSVLWNIYVKEGIVETYYGGSINNNIVKRDEVIIDGEKYSCDTGVKLDTFLAEYVEFIYEETSKDEKTVFYADSSDDQEEIKSIDASSIISFDRDNYAIVYENENGKEKYAKIDRGALIIYNGSVYEDSISDVLSEFINGNKNGCVKIIESVTDGLDMVVIESFRNFVVNYSDSEGRKFYNKLELGDVIDLDMYEEVLIRNMSDIDTQLSNSDTGYALSVSESKDKNRIKIITLTTSSTGVLNEIVNDGEEVIIDENVYKLDKTLSQSLTINNSLTNGLLKIGRSYKFYTDQFGYIAYIEETDPTGEYNVGYIISCDYGNDGVVKGKALKLKILTDKNSIEIFDVAEKTTVDEVKYQERLYALRAVELAAYEVKNPGADITQVTVKGITDYTGRAEQYPQITPQLIRYKINKNGEIYKIDTSHIGTMEDKDYTLTRQADVDGLDRPIYRQHTLNDGHFGSAILYKKGVTGVFLAPLTNDDGYLIAETDPSTVLSGNIAVPALSSLTPVKTNVYDNSGHYAQPADYMYQFSKNQSFYSDSRYSVVAYNYTKTSPYADAIVCNYNRYEENENAIMFENITTALNENGDVCKLLKGWQAGSQVSYIVSDNSDLSSFELGDLLYSWISIDKKEIIFVKKVYDASENKFVNLPHTYDNTRSVPEYWWSIAYNTYNGSTGKITGYQHSARWVLTKGKLLDKNQNVLYWDWDGNYRDYEESMDISTVPIVICNFTLRDDNIKIGTIQDVTDYKTVGENSSYLVMNMRHSQGRCAYIYIK